MSRPATDLPASRQAALLIHGLPAAARREVLGRLSADERRRVVPLLDELEALGIPRQAMPVAPAPAVGKRGDVDGLARADVAQVVAALRPCSAATVARVLDLQDWPWCADVLAAFDAPRRDRIGALRGGTLPPAVAASLRRSFVASVRAVPASAPASPSGLKRMLAWMR